VPGGRYLLGTLRASGFFVDRLPSIEIASWLVPAALAVGRSIRIRNSARLISLVVHCSRVSILVGVERNVVQRAAAVERLEEILDFAERADRFQGAWPHWLLGESGRVKPPQSQ
jgi:hypothetical protein